MTVAATMDEHRAFTDKDIAAAAGDDGRQISLLKLALIHECKLIDLLCRWFNTFEMQLWEEGRLPEPKMFGAPPRH